MPKANEVKNVKKTAVADVKVEKAVEVKEEVKATPVKEVAKVEETKAVKAADTKTTEVKAEEKAPAAKKTVEKKTTAKTAEKKETTKKATTTKSKVTESVCVQFCGNEYDVAAVVEKAKAAYAGDAKKMKDIKVYIKPEEGMAYYVVNGDETGSVAL